MRPGLVVKKTYPSDFDRVYPLLLDFDSPYSCEEWKKIFEYRWDGSKDYIGYHLEHNETIVGFMGLIFSVRLIGGIKYEFCNITSLIVKPNYRESTLLFIRQLMRLTDCILTGFSPIIESYQLLKSIGFVPFEKQYKIIPVVHGMFSKKSKINVSEMPKILEKVDGEGMRIIRDHTEKKGIFVLFELKNQTCLVVYKQLQAKYAGILVNKIQVIHMSDHSFFSENFDSILKIFMNKYGMFTALYLDGRFAPSVSKYVTFTKEIYPPRICMGDISHTHIDELYSESMLL
ncbi:MAG: hypothetical protein QNK11_01480 [Legionella sp.]|nr:hypothetical protein [Legionella sp.]